jgi:cytochrome b
LSAAPDAPRSVPVWDPLVRIGHWSLVVCVAVSWATGEGGAGWHEGFGYAALAIITIRIVWGFAGPRTARFADFVRTPAATVAYGLRVLSGTEPRHLGHNPLGGWMIVALIICIVATGFTGWLYTTDRYWGVEWVGELHEALANTLLVLIALHVAGVILASWRHRENLVAAMLHGRKRAENENA